MLTFWLMRMIPISEFGCVHRWKAASMSERCVSAGGEDRVVG